MTRVSILLFFISCFLPLPWQVHTWLSSKWCCEFENYCSDHELFPTAEDKFGSQDNLFKKIYHPFQLAYTANCYCTCRQLLLFSIGQGKEEGRGRQNFKKYSCKYLNGIDRSSAQWIHHPATKATTKFLKKLQPKILYLQ